jgi:hypothetical protein
MFTGSIAFAGVVKLKNKRLDNMQKIARGNRMLFTAISLPNKPSPPRRRVMLPMASDGDVNMSDSPPS